MITLNLKINDKYQEVKIQEDIIFNSLLTNHPELIKKLIKAYAPSYKINEAFFKVVNGYAEFTEHAVSIYTGLIVRTNYDSYAVLYLENSTIDEERMMELIREFIYDIDDIPVKNVNINKMPIDSKTFLIASRNI